MLIGPPRFGMVEKKQKRFSLEVFKEDVAEFELLQRQQPRLSQPLPVSLTPPTTAADVPITFRRLAEGMFE